MESLPSPRQFLDSLLSSLPKSFPPETNQVSPSSNPLKSLDQANRNILITLHVLYPSILLHSLDLLDRGLVTKVIQIEEPSELQPSQEDVHPRIQHDHKANSGEEKSLNQNSIYLVRSAQTPTGTRSRQSNSSKVSPKTYTVHLLAWNCSCAAFAFSAYPPVSSLFSPQGDFTGTKIQKGEGEVGGMTFDGMIQGDGKDGGVAMCKHLLACLLVERWGGVLGMYVTEKRVGRNEMAGLGADV